MAITKRIATVYRHEQSVAATTWTITHGLKDYPIIDVFVDYQGEIHKIIPSEITYVDQNTCTVTFTTDYSGFATVC